jgi:hypothetical protein
VKGGPDPNCKGATEKIDATDRPQREIADRSGMSAVAQMASVSMSAIVPLLGDNRTQRGHHQNDVNDPRRSSAQKLAGATRSQPQRGRGICAHGALSPERN